MRGSGSFISTGSPRAENCWEGVGARPGTRSTRGRCEIGLRLLHGDGTETEPHDALAGNQALALGANRLREA